MIKILNVRKFKDEKLNSSIKMTLIDLHNCKREIVYSPYNDRIIATLFNKRTGMPVHREYNRNNLSIEKFGENMLKILNEEFNKIYK